MFKVVSTLSLAVFVSFALGLVALLSNEWFLIRGKSKSCGFGNGTMASLADCLRSGVKRGMDVVDAAESRVRFGLWYACSIGLTKKSLAWASAVDPDECFKFGDDFRRTQLLAAYLNDAYLIDLSPANVGKVQIFFSAGLILTFVSTLLALYAFVAVSSTIDNHRMLNIGWLRKWLARKANDNNKNSKVNSKATFVSTLSPINHYYDYSNSFLNSSFNNNHKRDTNRQTNTGKLTNLLYVLFGFLIFELVFRLLAFVIFSISAEDYLGDLITHSYAIHNITDEFNVKIVLLNYELYHAWSYWLTLVSLLTSSVALLANLMLVLRVGPVNMDQLQRRPVQKPNAYVSQHRMPTVPTMSGLYYDRLFVNNNATGRLAPIEGSVRSNTLSDVDRNVFAAFDRFDESSSSARSQDDSYYFVHNRRSDLHNHENDIRVSSDGVILNENYPSVVFRRRSISERIFNDRKKIAKTGAASATRRKESLKPKSDLTTSASADRLDVAKNFQALIIREKIKNSINNT